MWFTIYEFYPLFNHYMKKIPVHLQLKLQKRGPGWCGLGALKSKTAVTHPCFIPTVCLPLSPHCPQECFPGNQGEKQGTKRNLFSPRGHGFSESPQRQGLSRRYERGAPLSTSATRSLVGGSYECLLSAYYALGTSELFSSVTNISFFKQWAARADHHQ